jgi:hypothetical protein
MTQRIENQRNWVKGHFTEDSINKYDTIEGKLYLLQGILDNEFYSKNQTMELQSLGIAFGDALAQKLKLEWMEVEDEYGIDPALVHIDTSIRLFPLTMISKRIENNEKINVEELFNGICGITNEQIEKNNEGKK